jgi:transcriptional regulator with XRE-family HTH domain
MPKETPNAAAATPIGRAARAPAPNDEAGADAAVCGIVDSRTMLLDRVFQHDRSLSSTADHTPSEDDERAAGAAREGDGDGDERAAGGAADVDAFVRAVAGNIRSLRREAGLTLAELAAAAGLGRSTLAQLESGRGNPSVETLWALAAALAVPFARLVEEQRAPLRVTRRADAPTILSQDTPGWVGRLLANPDRRGTFEVYSVEFGDGETRHAEPHHAGVVEHLVVVTGRLRVGPATGTVELGPGDLATYVADVPHVYETLEAGTAVLVMSYP